MFKQSSHHANASFFDQHRGSNLTSLFRHLIVFLITWVPASKGLIARGHFAYLHFSSATACYADLPNATTCILWQSVLFRRCDNLIATGRMKEGIKV